MPTAEGFERTTQVDSILAAANKTLTKDEYTELLVSMDQVSEDYLGQIKAAKEQEELDRQQKAAQIVKENQKDLMQPYGYNNEWAAPAAEEKPPTLPGELGGARKIPWWAVGTPGYGE